MIKRKLDKLIDELRKEKACSCERQECLAQAKQLMLDNSTRKPSRNKSIFKKLAIVSMACILSIVTITCSVVFTKGNVASGGDDIIQGDGSMFCYEKDTTKRNIASINEYNQQNKTDYKSLPFNDKVDRTASAYNTFGEDVLLCEQITLLDTWESITSYTGKSKYTIMFLSPIFGYNMITKQILGVSVSYFERFSETIQGYTCYAKFQNEGKNYFVITNLLKENAWEDIVTKLIA